MPVIVALKRPDSFFRLPEISNGMHIYYYKRSNNTRIRAASDDRGMQKQRQVRGVNSTELRYRQRIFA